ncbi:MAG TPA: dUTP diphosphatase [Pyrinomonadaceae bacterium]|jgi:dUTP pyrophosphatase|nr:dUTP diphosphatase [Pyrinomonadaceae bacterium]
MFSSLRFQKLHESATLPTRGSRCAAGLDLYSVEGLTIRAGQRAVVGTGLSVAIPEGFYGRVAPRSGLAIEHGLDVLAGVIDSDYRGEIRCALINHGSEPVSIQVGQRVAQLIIEVIATPEPDWADNLEETARGAGGFGSTG